MKSSEIVKFQVISRKCTHSYISQEQVPVGSMWDCIPGLNTRCTITYQGYQYK